MFNMDVYNRTARYQISTAEYDWLLEVAKLCCNLCRSAFLSSTPHLDHAHDCERASLHIARGKYEFGCAECIRGVLCKECNMELGVVEDWIARGLVTPSIELAAYFRRRPLVALRQAD
jgi:hypothetical protein